MRRRILDISQTVPALHIAPAFSCLEIVDTIYFGLMRRDGHEPDSFILSKGHGAMAQYAVLEELGVMSKDDLDSCGKDGGHLGMHPDIGMPGIEASTGSLGHGLPLALGMALADKALRSDRSVYCVISDGELEEGSVWEAMMLAPTLGLERLVVVVDLNDFQSLGKISEIHPNFYPLLPKIQAFGWNTIEVNGHEQGEIHEAVTSRPAGKPFMVVARTVKGKGVSYMENAPIWHYRSPSPEEYRRAVGELEQAS